MKNITDYILEGINKGLWNDSKRYGSGPKPNITNEELDRIKTAMGENAKYSFNKSGSLVVVFDDGDTYTINKYDDQHVLYPSDVYDQVYDAIEFRGDWKKWHPNQYEFFSKLAQKFIDDGNLSNEEFESWKKWTEVVDGIRRMHYSVTGKWGLYYSEYGQKELDAENKDSEYINNWVKNNVKPVHGFALRHKTNSGYTIMFRKSKTKWPEDVLLNLDDFIKKLESKFK